MRERRLKKALQKRRAAKANNKAGKVTEEKRKVIKATNTELAKPVKGAKSAKGAKAVKGHFFLPNAAATHPEKALAHEQLALKPVPDDKAKEILLKRQTKAIRDVREELLESRSSVKTNGIAATSSWSGGGEDFDAVLRYHNSMQEKIAEEMVSLAQNLKQNAVLAGHIVKKDTEAVQKSVQSAEQNYDRLQNEQRRLEEHLRELFRKLCMAFDACLSVTMPSTAYSSKCSCDFIHHCCSEELQNE
ncbi:hypothetical protein HPB52_024371 [Rhipicephalus sanguineus]|uniref:Vesicle transport protein USE1 n=1 Tax=Rhipicephalus sanguineus TaxID=34632 RepID=A0A9D4PB40_RHISA|nr:hypothetical protein HPB52_024371 [Rhipicephalus sanguineus]